MFSITDALLDGRSHIDSVAVGDNLLWAPCLQRTRALTIVSADRKLRQTYYTKITLTYYIITLLHYVIIINIIIIIMVEARLVQAGDSGFRVYI